MEGIYLFTSGVPDQHPDQCIAYVEEALKGRGCKLHTILFNVDDYDNHGAIPGRWSNITETADLFRTMAHVTGGRFHWFRETGWWSMGTDFFYCNTNLNVLYMFMCQKFLTQFDFEIFYIIACPQSSHGAI